MRRLPALALSTLALTPALALLPTPAQAGSSATNVTFTVSGGSLTVSAPASKTLSAATLSLTGASISGQLGSTTISDTRGVLGDAFNVTMSSTNFDDGSGNTINASNVSGYSGAVTPVSGVALTVPTATDQPLAGTGSNIVTVTGVAGTASFSYNPTVDITVPADAPAATYTGTVTQTAA